MAISVVNLMDLFIPCRRPVRSVDRHADMTMQCRWVRVSMSEMEMECCVGGREGSVHADGVFRV